MLSQMLHISENQGAEDGWGVGSFRRTSDVQHVLMRPGRPAFNPRSRQTKDFKKWYLIYACLTLSNIRYVSRVKCSNPGKGVAPSPTPRCSSN